MNRLILSIILFGVTILQTTAAQGNERHLTIAAGAGYKKPVTDILRNYEADSGTSVDAVFGNLQTVTTQARQSGDIAVIIGDRKFLAALEKTLAFSGYTRLGRGIPVIASRKGITMHAMSDLLSPSVKSVFLPQTGKAIYGIAGRETLRSLGYDTLINGKLTETGTVPQVVSYLVTGEADAGFINLTEALADSGRFGSFITVPDSCHAPIDIVAGVVKEYGTAGEVRSFTQYLSSEKARAILKRYGLY